MLDTERETEMKLALKVLLSRKALLGALPVVVALLLSGVISFSYNLLLKNYRDAVDHTFQVMSGIDNVLLRLQDAETGQRGFIIEAPGDAQQQAQLHWMREFRGATEAAMARIEGAAQQIQGAAEQIRAQSPCLGFEFHRFPDARGDLTGARGDFLTPVLPGFR